MPNTIYENEVSAIEIHLMPIFAGVSFKMSRFRFSGGWKELSLTDPKILTCDLPMPDNLEHVILEHIRLRRKLKTKHNFIFGGVDVDGACKAWENFLGVK